MSLHLWTLPFVFNEGNIPFSHLASWIDFSGYSSTLNILHNITLLTSSIDQSWIFIIFVANDEQITFKTCSNWSKTLWKYRLVVSELVAGSDELDIVSWHRYFNNLLSSCKERSVNFRSKFSCSHLNQKTNEIIIWILP